PEDVRIALGMVVALALAIPSLWATRPAVAVLSGMWAALATILLLDRLGVDDQVTLVAAAVIFAGAASMVFVSMKEMVAVVTSLEGTLLFLAGLIVLVNQNPLVWAHMRNMLVRNPIFAPFLVLSGTIIGFYLQIAEFQKKQAGQSA
ncbi:MAG: hypothetical protein HY718_15650, partial [Planctomycetes bacterium]|nr:hypothetical protein [Planctomycetota bacterium]